VHFVLSNAPLLLYKAHHEGNKVHEVKVK